MGKIKIDHFRIYGKITEDEERRIRALLPKTELIINGMRSIDLPKPGSYPSSILN